MSSILTLEDLRKMDDMLHTGVYRTIYADPPWPERGGGKIRRGANRHYKLMSVAEIADLKYFVQELADPDGCHLYLWVTNNFLPHGLDVMSAWGWRYVTKVDWHKEGNPGLGQYFQGHSESCLFGVRGRVPYKTANGKRQRGTTSIYEAYDDIPEELASFQAPRGRHSEKPEKMREMIETVSYEPRIELFARTQPPGWDVWGNEV